MTEPTSITDMVRALETERDALRARVTELTERCVAQELVIARVRSLRAALDEYGAEHPAPPTDTEIAMPERAAKAAPSPHARRYSEADAREWLAELRAGTSCADLWRERHVAIDTVQRWIKRLVPDATFDSGRLVERPRMAPIRHTCAKAGRFTDVQILEAGERMRGGLSAVAVAAMFYTDVETLQAGLRRLEMDPETGQFTHRPPEEELLREPASYATDDEEEPEDERLAEAV